MILDDKFSIVYRSSVFDEATMFQYDVGMSVEDALNEISPKMKKISEVRDNETKEELDLDYIPEPAQTLEVTPQPGSSDQFKSLIMVAAVVAAVYIFAAAAAAASTASTWAATGKSLYASISGASGWLKGLIGLGLSLFMNRDRGGGGGRETFNREDAYFASGSQNQIKPGALVPITLGQFRKSADLAANPYTTVNGYDTFLHLLLCWGVAPMEVSDIKIGNVPIENFEDVEMEHSWEIEDNILDFPNYVEDNYDITLTNEWSPILETRGEASEIGVLISYPRGLYRINDRGGSSHPGGQIGGYEMRYRLKRTQEEKDAGMADRPWNIVHKTIHVPSRNGPFIRGNLINAGHTGDTLVPGKTTYRYETKLEYVINPRYGDDGEPYQIQKYVTRRIATKEPDKYIPKSGPLPTGRYEVSVRRLTPYDLDPDNRDSKLIDEMKVVTVQTVKNEKPVTTPNLALTRVKIKASSQQNGNIENINALVGMRMDLYDPVTRKWPHDGDRDTRPGGVSTNYGISKNPADILRHILTSPYVNPDPLSRGRVGYDDGEIDEDNLGELWEFCAENDLNYSKIIMDKNTPILELANEIAAIGISSIADSFGKWGVIIDKERSVAKHMITPRNSDAFRMHYPISRYPHALEVFFSNEDEDYQFDQLTVYDDGYGPEDGRRPVDADNLEWRPPDPTKDGDTGNLYDPKIKAATRIQDVNMAGVTDYKTATRVARYMLAVGKLRPYTFEVEVGYHNFLVNRGDRVYFSHDSALIGQTTGRILNVNKSTGVVEVDEACTFVEGKPYEIFVLRTNGQIVKKRAEGHGTTRFLNIVDGSSNPSADNLEEGMMYQFGERTTVVQDCIVLDKECIDDKHAVLTLTPYSPNIFNSSEKIPEFRSIISKPVTRQFYGPLEPRFDGENILSDERSLPQNLTGARIPAMKLFVLPGTSASNNKTVSPTKSFVVRWKKTSEDIYQEATFPASTPEYIINNVESRETYNVGVKAIGVRGESAWVDTVHTVVGLAAEPPDVTAFNIDNVDNQLFFRWIYNNAPGDLEGFEIRYSFKKFSSGTTPDPWDRMIPLEDIFPAGTTFGTGPAIEGTFAIKAFDTSGNYSINPVYAGSPPLRKRDTLDAITIQVSPGWANEKKINATGDDVPDGYTSLVDTKLPSGYKYATGVIKVTPGHLRLIPTAYTRRAPTMNNWPTLDKLTSMVLPARTEYAALGYYNTQVQDVGAVINTTLYAYMEAGTPVALTNLVKDWERLGDIDPLQGLTYSEDVWVRSQYRRANGLDAGTGMYDWIEDDSTEAGGWKNLQEEDVSGRYFQFRVKLVSEFYNITPNVDSLSFRISVDARREQGTNVTSSTVNDLTITFAEGFYRAPSVIISPQDMLDDEYFVRSESETTKNQFKISFYRKVDGGDDVRVARKFDWVADGYGSVPRTG